MSIQEDIRKILKWLLIAVAVVFTVYSIYLNCTFDLTEMNLNQRFAASFVWLELAILVFWGVLFGGAWLFEL